jgi:hypothetical protein
MARAGSGMGMGGKRGSENAGNASPDAFSEAEMANDIRGKNRLQGQDQKRVRNQRQEQAHAGVGKRGTRGKPRRQQG